MDRIELPLAATLTAEAVQTPTLECSVTDDTSLQYLRAVGRGEGATWRMRRHLPPIERQTKVRT